MSLTLVTDSLTTPVSLTEVKNDRVIDLLNTEDDDLLNSLISAATLYAENLTGRSFVNKTYKEEIDSFPSDDWYLSVGNAATVNSITYKDINNTQQTLSTDDYEYISDGELVKIRSIDSYPDTYESFNAVTVEYVAGYGDETVVPELIKKAILLIIGSMYEHRENHSAGVKLNQIPMSAEMILQQFKVYSKR